MTWQHGASGYRNYKCRCDICKAGWAAEVKVYRQRRKIRKGERILHGRFVADPERGKEGTDG